MNNSDPSIRYGYPDSSDDFKLTTQKERMLKRKFKRELKLKRARKYYRILNTDMIHRGFQWKIGLNVDPIKFDSIVECGPGGLYFCDKSDISTYIDKHTLVAGVTIPDDAQVKFYDYKAKASKLIIDTPVSLWSLADDMKICATLIHNCIPIPTEYQTLPLLIRWFNENNDCYFSDMPQEHVTMLNTLLKLNPTYYTTLFSNDPNLYKYCRKTPEMSQYMFRNFLHETYRYIPQHHLTDAIITHHLKWCVDGIRHISRPSIAHQWQAIRYNPEQIMFIRPTPDQVRYVLDMSPFMGKFINRQYLTNADLFEIFLTATTPELEHVINKYTGELYDRCAAVIQTRYDSELLIKRFSPAMRKLVDQIPLIKYVFTSGIIYGSFVRWLIYTTITNDAVPTITDVYEFLKHSDIDIKMRTTGFSQRAFINVVQKIGGRVEFTDCSSYSSVRKGKFTVGHYHVWVPVATSNPIQWLKYDFMIGSNDYPIPDFTVNASTMSNTDIHVVHFADIMSKTIRPVSLVEHYPAKLLMRIGKLLSRGYTLDTKQIPAIKYLFERVSRNLYDTYDYITGDLKAPSHSQAIAYNCHIPTTAHKSTLLTKTIFENNQTIIDLRRLIDN